MDRLDPSRSVFLEKEVNSFAAKDLDAEINDQHASLEQAFKIFELYRSRYQERFQLQKNLLSEIETLDLKQNRKFLRTEPSPIGKKQ